MKSFREYIIEDVVIEDNERTRDLLNEESLLCKMKKMAIRKIIRDLEEEYGWLINKYYNKLPDNMKKQYDEHMRKFRKENIKEGKNILEYKRMYEAYYEEAEKTILGYYKDYLEAKIETRQVVRRLRGKGIWSPLENI